MLESVGVNKIDVGIQLARTRLILESVGVNKIDVRIGWCEQDCC